MTDWKPIESAPKDGTRILGYDGVEMEVIHAVSGIDGIEWIYGEEWVFIPIIWQPLDMVRAAHVASAVIRQLGEQ